MVHAHRPREHRRFGGGPTPRGSSEQTRDEIFESVLRRAIRDFPRQQTFFGFEHSVETKGQSPHKVYLNPNAELVSRLHDLRGRLEPLSSLKLPPDGLSANPQVCLLWFITMRSPKEAEVDARLGGYNSTSAVLIYRLVASHGHWQVVGRREGALISTGPANNSLQATSSRADARLLVPEFPRYE